jgi:hypothetical protein
MPSFVEKYQKIKYAISDRPHGINGPLWIIFFNYWMDHIETLTDIKIKLKKNQTFFTIGPVVVAPCTQTCATELKKWSLVHHLYLLLHPRWHGVEIDNRSLVNGLLVLSGEGNSQSTSGDKVWFFFMYDYE